MKYSLLPAALLTIAVATHALAQDPAFRVKQSTESDVDFFVTNYGLLGLDVDGNAVGFESPRGSRNGYLMGSGLWFGARKSVRDSSGVGQERSLVFLTYNPNSGASWAYPQEWPRVAIPPDPLPELYHSIDYDTTTGAHIAPIEPPAGRRPWPLWLRAGESTTPMFAGHFVIEDDQRNLSAGAYYAVAYMEGADEQFVSRFHDMALERYEMGQSEAIQRGYPIGLHIEQNVYGWKAGRYREVVVIDYMIINRSSDTLRDCVIGQAADPDLGSPINDHVEFYGARPELRAARAWTEREVQGTWGELVMVLLEAPVANDSGYIDNRQRANYKLGGRLGSFPPWSIADEPVTDAQRYEFMTSGAFAQDDSAVDRRALLASTTFDMLPGDTAHCAIAFGVLHGSFGRARDKGFILTKEGSGSADEALEQFATAIIDDHYAGRYNSDPDPASSPLRDRGDVSLSVTPSPARGVTSVEFALERPSPVEMRVVDLVGRTVLTGGRSMYDSGVHRATLDCSSLPAGTYTLILDADSRSMGVRFGVVR